jgi:methylated-DNA-protein-cysteine methyltransferase-like protein
MTEIFTARTRAIIRRIPPGKVMTYGIIAAYAGNRGGARQVARILHSSSEKYGLPWHRVVNRNGRISPRSSQGHLLQRRLLEEEGVIFGKNGRIDLAVFLWRPERSV